MNKFGRATLLTLLAAVFALGTVGCKSSGKERHDAPPAAEQPPKGDHPKH